MRTTVTLDPDTEQLVRRRMKERKVSFKKALNDLLREGGAPVGTGQEFRTATVAMGRSRVNLDRALQLTSELEDDDLVRKMRSGS